MLEQGPWGEQRLQEPAWPAESNDSPFSFIWNMAGADNNCRNDLFRQKLIFTRLPVEKKSALALAEHIQNPMFASTPPNRQNIKNFDSEGPDPLKSNFQWTCRFSSCRLKDKNKYSLPRDSLPQSTCHFGLWAQHVWAGWAWTADRYVPGQQLGMNAFLSVFNL